MGRQTVTPEQWLAGIEVSDENPTIRDLAGQVLHLLWFRKSQAEHLDRRLQQLAPLCPCDKNDLPLRECPVHGDGKTFVAEVRELRAIRDRASERSGWVARVGTYAQAASEILGEA